ncbi:MAG: serine/threonine protein kinase, partial [Oscillospiraceae bacterium]|nr:serine/threonine protein kinase [Oscillospiraceae bacterium]
MIEINNKKLCESCFAEIDAAETCPCCGYNRSEFTPDPMVLPLGTKLNDKIIIGRVMGKGGFGITYLGYDTRMDKTIAVKEYYPNGISYRAPGGTEVAVADAKSAETFESGAEKFYTEAEMVSQFNGNPNIVSVYDYFRANSTVYLIMEYLSGITLKNYVKKHGKLTDGQALYVMDKIVAALSITHSAGVLHRDISPDNIMICSDGKVKLIDFGAARQILTESSSNLTVVMKPGYTPIEQYTKKGKQGAWTDIYSLGVSMYYALTKVIIDDPYARMDSDEEFNENKYKINDSLWVILKKCTMINASDRYGSAIDLRKALKSVSAPLTPEMIELSAEDLKDEPEEKEDTVAHTTAAPLDDDIPATVMGSDSDIAEEIEIFESSTPDEIADAVSDTGDDALRTAPVTAEQAQPTKKVTMIAAICSAAALVIVIAICIVVGLNKQKNPDITSDPNGSTSDGSTPGGSTPGSDSSSVKDDDIIYSSFYPEMKDGKLFFEMDSSYPATRTGKQISKDNLIRFDGDVKITLELEHLPSSEWEGDSILIVDRNDTRLDVMAFNKGICVYSEDSNGEYTIFPEQTEFSFVLSRSDIDNISGLKFWMWNMFVKSAVLEAYDPAELEPGGDAVRVNINSREHNSLSNFISLDILQSFNDNVKITLDIEYEKMESDIEKINAYICPYSSDWTEVAIEVENSSHTPWARDYFFELGSVDVPDKFVFTLPKSEIAKLDVNGLCFNSNNLYIRSATVEKADKTVIQID